MNHPKPDEWVPFIYGETTGPARRQLADHLHSCAQCRDEIETWQRTVKGLNRWKMPRRQRLQLTTFAPVLNWAMAAAVVLFAGVFIGRATAPKVDIEKLKVAIAPQIQRDLSSQLAELAREEAARAVSLNLASGRRYTDQVAQQLYVALKKDVDTVALNADAGLRNTAQQLFQLADFKQPQSLNNPNE